MRTRSMPGSRRWSARSCCRSVAACCTWRRPAPSAGCTCSAARRCRTQRRPAARCAGPPANSALGLLWPAVGHAFVERLARARRGRGRGGAASAARSAAAPSAVGLACRRRCRERRASNRSSCRAPRPSTAVEFDWATETARHVGTVVHRELQRMARDDVRPVGADDPRSRRRWQDELAELGVPAATACRGGGTRRECDRADAGAMRGDGGCSMPATATRPRSSRSPGAWAADSCGS